MREWQSTAGAVAGEVQRVAPLVALVELATWLPSLPTRPPHLLSPQLAFLLCKKSTDHGAPGMGLPVHFLADIDMCVGPVPVAPVGHRTQTKRGPKTCPSPALVRQHINVVIQEANLSGCGFSASDRMNRRFTWCCCIVAGGVAVATNKHAHAGVSTKR